MFFFVRQRAQRSLTLVDASARTIECTVWGTLAENFSAADAPVVAFKALRVSDFGNKSLSSVNSECNRWIFYFLLFLK